MLRLESVRKSSVRFCSGSPIPLLHENKFRTSREGCGGTVHQYLTVRYFMYSVRLEILTRLLNQCFRIRNSLSVDPDPVIYLVAGPLQIQFRIRNTV